MEHGSTVLSFPVTAGSKTLTARHGETPYREDRQSECPDVMSGIVATTSPQVKTSPPLSGTLWHDTF